MKISLIVPVYNVEDYIRECIDGILKMNYKNYEIIIIENNSNEETFAYYDSLKKYPQIKVVVYKPEGGFNYSAINNYGAKFAKGEHILLLNIFSLNYLLKYHQWHHLKLKLVISIK